ncbi:hypothetical protein V1498_16685 [Peribacillus sp. SCS-26]
MRNKNESNMVNSKSVNKQLNELEKTNATTKQKGSTNEINPAVTDEGLSQ